MSFGARSRSTGMSNLLQSKNVILYGAGGRVGQGIARHFAREGARVFVTGRTRAPLDELATSIRADGGRAEVAVVDATDAKAVAAHADMVVREAGSIDVSFNLIVRGDIQGKPLLDMEPDEILSPISIGVRSNIITAQAAARRMKRGGVILMITSGSSEVTMSHRNPYHMGGTGPADAAQETFMRYFAAEVGARGVRVVGIWAAGVIGWGADRDAATQAKAAEWDAMIDGSLGKMSMLGHAQSLAQVAEAAAFLASDQASGITASIVNVTNGLMGR